MKAGRIPPGLFYAFLISSNNVAFNMKPFVVVNASPIAHHNKADVELNLILFTSTQVLLINADSIMII